MKKKWIAVLVMLMLAMAGSAENPFATPAYAAAQAEPGTEVIVHEGKYGGR